VFLLALFIEMTHPGLILPGAIAAGALVGLLAPPMLINMASWWEVAAIASGLLLIVLEIFVIPGFGVFGLLGLVLLFGGIVGTFVPQGGLFPDSPGPRTDLLYGAVTLILAIGTSGVLMYFVSRHFASLPIFHRLVLKETVYDEDKAGDEMLAVMGEGTGKLRTGMVGTAMTPLRPAGRIELSGGRIIDVVSDTGYIASGTLVRVTGVSDFRVGVEPAAEGGGPGGQAADGPRADTAGGADGASS